MPNIIDCADIIGRVELKPELYEWKYSKFTGLHTLRLVEWTYYSITIAGEREKRRRCIIDVHYHYAREICIYAPE